MSTKFPRRASSHSSSDRVRTPRRCKGAPLSANAEERSEMLAVLCLWRGPGVVEQGKLTAFHCKTYTEKTAYV